MPLNTPADSLMRIKVFTVLPSSSMVFHRPTGVIWAKAQADEIIAGADHGAIANIMASAAMDTNAGGIAERLKSGLSLGLEEGNMAFMGIPVLAGSPETLALRIDEIAEETGIDGMLFSWPDFVGGITDFGERVMPLLKCRN